MYYKISEQGRKRKKGKLRNRLNYIEQIDGYQRGNRWRDGLNT